MPFTFLLLFLFTTSLGLIQGAETEERSLPPPREYLYDETGILSSSFKKRLENALKKHEKRYDKKMVVLFLQSLQGENIQSFAFRFVKKLDSDLKTDLPVAVLVVSVSDRKVQVVLNSEAQKVWPSRGSGKVIAAATPFFRGGDYQRGLLQALNHMAGNFGVQTRGEDWFQEKNNNRLSWIIIILVGLLIILFGRGRRMKESWFYYKRKNEGKGPRHHTKIWGGKIFTPMGKKWELSPLNIEKALEEARTRTSVAIVPVVLKQSDFYPAAHFRSSILLALIFNPLVYLLMGEWQTPLWHLIAQVPALMAGYLLCFRPRFKRFFSTKAEIKEEVHQKALELFYREKAGEQQMIVLIFIGLLEKRVELIPDPVLLQHLSPQQIQPAIKEMTRTIRREGMQEGLLRIIQSLGDLLQSEFPSEEAEEEMEETLDHTSSDQDSD